ncbi:MAG TPA: hypothetical protein VLG40_02075 [Candidatus Saccharimonas sp.]|nr:hypothetical protein [Candidatus Saccharimonas sp.]
MKVNTEATKFDRVKVVIGWVLFIIGIFIITVIGSFYGYESTTVWVAGFLLVSSGLLIAKSLALAHFLTNFLG